MSKHRNTANGVVVSVADEKDARFSDGWVKVEADKPKRTAPSKNAGMSSK